MITAAQSSEPDVTVLLDVVRELAALHKRVKNGIAGGGDHWITTFGCEHCASLDELGVVYWPCPTAKILNRLEETAPDAAPIDRRMRARRSDVSTEMIFAAITEHEFSAFRHLSETYPPKVVLAAFRRDIDRGWLEYGVSEVHCWITPAGLARGAAPDSQTSTNTTRTGRTAP